MKISEKLYRALAMVLIAAYVSIELASGTAKIITRKNASDIKIYDAISTVENAVLTGTALYIFSGAKFLPFAKFANGFLLSAFAIESLKHIVKRERPDKTNTKSFPSGHAGIAMISTLFLLQQFAKKRKLLYPVITLLVCISVCALRVLAKRHYLSDVLSACLVSLMCFIISNYLSGFFVKKFIKN